MEESAALINQPDAKCYTKLIIVVDVILFLLAAWSEIGYSIFTGSSTSESILDPLKRYLFPLLSADTANKIIQTLNIVTQVLSYSDALLTIATILDVKKKREKFVKEIRSGFRQLKYREIKIIPFLLNLLVFLFSFLVISLSPWIGLKLRNFDYDIALGLTMFLGQMTVLLLQYGNYIFATPKRIVDFFKLTRNDKKTVFCNIFCTRKGIAVALRTLANTTVMGLRFHGMGLFANKHIFGNNPTVGTIYSITASVSIVYRILLTQSFNDYKTKFTEEADFQEIHTKSTQEIVPEIQNGTGNIQEEILPEIQNNTRNIQEEILPEIQIDTGNIKEEIIPENQRNTGNACTKLLLFLLWILIALTFLLRTFSTPVLCTGPIENPEENYDIATTLLATLGLVLGSFAAFQYCKFMWGLGKAAAKHISNLQCCRSTNHSDGTRERHQGNLCDSETEDGRHLLSPVQPSV